MSLGVKSAAMKSLLSAGSNRVQELLTPSSALAAFNDPYRMIVLDGAVTPSAAAIRIRKWGLVEALARRIQSGNALLACGESAISLGVGQLDGKVRGLGVIPSRIGRVSREYSAGLQTLDTHDQSVWFNHNYALLSSSSNCSFTYGDVQCVAFDPARSGVYGRTYVRRWLSSSMCMNEEAA